MPETEIDNVGLPVRTETWTLGSLLVAAYEIVWRSTDAPQWERARYVGNVTEATVPVSKDDDVLGVRSVDSSGLRSPAVYPVAVRE